MKINGEVEANVPHIIQTRMPRTRREAGHSRGLLRGAPGKGNAAGLPEQPFRITFVPRPRPREFVHRSFHNRGGAKAARPHDCARRPRHRRPFAAGGPAPDAGGVGNVLYDLLTIFWDSLRRRPISTQSVAAEVECKWESE